MSFIFKYTGHKSISPKGGAPFRLAHEKSTEANKALDMYRLELDDIKKKHDQSLDEAKAIYNKTIADAQVAFDSAVSEITSAVNNA